MSLITLISTSRLTLVFMMTRTLNLNFVEIAGIRVEPLVYVPNIKNGNSQINRGSTIWSNAIVLTLTCIMMLTAVWYVSYLLCNQHVQMIFSS